MKTQLKRQKENLLDILFCWKQREIWETNAYLIARSNTIFNNMRNNIDENNSKKEICKTAFETVFNQPI